MSERAYYSRVGAERLAPDQQSKLDRLRYTLSQARQGTFYGEHLDGHDAQTLDELRNLPLTRKAHLKERPPEHFLACDLEKVWHFHESFGTTGRPVCGWYSLDDIECEIDVIGRWHEPFRPGQVVMNRYPYAFPVPAQLTEAAVRLKGGCLIPTSNLVFNVGFPRVIRLMEQRGAGIITAMPLEPILLKEAALLQGKDPKTAFPKMEAFCVAGRIVTPSWMGCVEDDWGVKLHNLYGCTEGGPFATSDASGQLILHDDFFLFEVIDPETLEPLVGDDVTGGLVATTLGREAQPMVRYYTEDLVRVRRLEDGRRAVDVLGRAAGLLTFGGVQVSNYDLEEAVLSWSRQHRANVFFVIVTSRGFLVRLEVPEGSKADASDGQRWIADRLGVPVKLELLPRGRLVNHASLVTSAAVFKPNTVSDHREPGRHVINHSGALVDWWVDVTPSLMMDTTAKWFLDQGTKWRLKLLGW